VDGPKVTTAPGKIVNLTATIAPNDAAAAEYYPGIYWFSMLKIPSAADFGGEGRIPKGITQSAWLNQMKNNGCVGCHQLGQKATRTIPQAFGTFNSSSAAWLRRVSSGQSGQQMTEQLLSLGPLGAQMLGDWTDRIAKGELPRTKPTRPQGIERNVVVTLEGLGDDKHYLHDIISTDKRKPTVNAYGPLYGSPEYSTDTLPVLDPVKHTMTTFHATVLDPNMPLSLGPGHAAGLKAMAPSAYWGEEQIWDTRVNNHNSMVDAKGRVWLAASTRGRENPGVLSAGFRSSIGEGLPDQGIAAPGGGVGCEGGQVHAAQPLFRDAPSGIRVRRERDRLVQRRRQRPRMDQHEDVRPDRRHREVAGMDGVRARHQRQRQARRVRRAQSAGGSDQGQADGCGVLRDHAAPERRIDLGLVSRQPGRRRPRGARQQSVGNGNHRGLQRSRARLRRARRRHRFKGRRLGVAGERSSRRIRPQQVQGSAQWTEGDWRSLP
jgi:hypothetical protein